MDSNDNYFDAPDEGAQPGDEGAEQQPPESQRESFLVNKSAFPNAQPGDEIMGRVVRVLPDELEVEPVEKDEDEQARPPADEMEPAPVGGGEDSLMS
jgi:hypothetical protein